LTNDKYGLLTPVDKKAVTSKYLHIQWVLTTFSQGTRRPEKEAEGPSHLILKDKGNFRPKTDHKRSEGE
jgi:hypothetical protein